MSGAAGYLGDYDGPGSIGGYRIGGGGPSPGDARAIVEGLPEGVIPSDTMGGSPRWRVGDPPPKPWPPGTPPASPAPVGRSSANRSR